MANVIRNLYLVITADGQWIHSLTTLRQLLAGHACNSVPLEFPASIPGLDHGVGGVLNALPVRVEDAKLAPGQMVILSLREMIVPELRPAAYTWQEL